MKERFERVKEQIKAHFVNHSELYLGGLAGLGIAGITCVIMRSISNQSITVAIGDGADSTIGGIGKKVVMSNVSFISANRKGSPSWVIRCLEDNAVETSQRKMALVKGLAQDHLSEHLNGKRDHVNGLHFERICMAG